MTLSDIASIASVISSLAVLASLVYLTIQVRQTEKNQRALMDQGNVNRATDINAFLAQPHINALSTRVLVGDTNFSAEDIGLLQLRLRNTMLATMDAYVQHKSGLADKAVLENSTAVMRYVLSQPVYRALWMGGRQVYSHEFQNYVEKEIADLPLLRPFDPAALLRDNLAKLKRDAPKPETGGT